MAESFKRKGFDKRLLYGIVIVVFPEQKDFLGVVGRVKADSVLQTLIERGAAFKSAGKHFPDAGYAFGSRL
jgi:hypothetical protein